MRYRKLYVINDSDMGKETFKEADISINIGSPVEIPQNKKTRGEKCLQR